MAIHILPDQLASQIAAGEVVERPASVVKELIENAIDAGAGVINVDVRGGGQQLVQVADDGFGIAQDEVEIAFMRHATSKLHSAEELMAIGTLGFRGEALAAIASMSRMTVVTRVNGQSAGVRLTLEAGRKSSREAVGAPRGTVIAVENLFYSVPARLKFLKSATTEKRLIDELVTRYALAYPRIRFRLAHDGRITFQSQGNGSAREVLAAVYGPEAAAQLLELPGAGEQPAEGADSGYAVAGFVGPPSLHWANRNHISLFVNGRWIRDTNLSYAIVQAYHTLLPTGRYPLAVLFLTVPLEQVDVNVHPAKTEVRFRQANALFGLVQRAVRHTLINTSPVRAYGAWPDSYNQEGLGANSGWQSSLDVGSQHRQSALELDRPAPAWDSDEPRTAPADRPTPPNESAAAGSRLPIMRVIGQVGSAYIIAEGPDGLFLIDQHAAHERILYEQFMADWIAAETDSGVATQGLVAGESVHLTPAQATLLTDQLPLLRRLGLVVEPFGPNTFMIRAIPARLGRLDPVRALVEVVEELERGDAPLQDRIEARIILRVCKTAAVKAGQSLAPVEMERMITQLEACQNPHTCPHGRPTLIHLSAAHLARQFGRM
jgi:DNA mismatch repair protein MutL